MRGKWTGVLNDSKNNPMEEKNILIEIYGRASEIVVGDTSDFKEKLSEAFDNEDIELDELMSDENIRLKYDLPEWWEIDNLLHVAGPLISDDVECLIKISEDSKILIEGNVSDLLNDEGRQIVEFEENYFDADDNEIFVGVNIEKGCSFSGILCLKVNEEFSINQLKIHAKEVMVSDNLVGICIHRITYTDEEIENTDFSTYGVLLDVNLYS